MKNSDTTRVFHASALVPAALVSALVLQTAPSQSQQAGGRVGGTRLAAPTQPVQGVRPATKPLQRQRTFTGPVLSPPVPQPTSVVLSGGPLVLPPAGATPYGSGCGPHGLETTANSRPHVGNSGFALVVKNANPGDVVGLVLGASNTEWIGRRLPMDLTAFGHAGCTLEASIDQVLLAPAGTGPVAFGMPVPSDTSLIGLALYAQGFATDGLRTFSMGNGLEVVVGL